MVPLAELVAGLAETSLAGLEIGQRLAEFVDGEIGPVDLGEVRFGVGKLPEQEITDAHLAAGPDQEIRIRQPARIQVASENLHADVISRELAGQHVAGQLCSRHAQFLPSAVGEGQGQDHAGVARGFPDCTVECLVDVIRQFTAVSDDIVADILAHHPCGFLADVFLEQGHQRPYLDGRARPVFRGESEQGQIPDSQQVGLLNHHLDRFCAALVADDAPEHALLGPAAVAVHDNGKVNGELVGVNGLHQTSSTSFSLWATASSTLDSKPLVTSWTSFSYFLSSSSVMSLSFSSFFSLSMASRRMLRRATLSSSAFFLRSLTISLRRSSVSGGRFRRMMRPSLEGVRPI